MKRRWLKLARSRSVRTSALELAGWASVDTAAFRTSTSLGYLVLGLVLVYISFTVGGDRR